jgi:hypothetical protein
MTPFLFERRSIVKVHHLVRVAVALFLIGNLGVVCAQAALPGDPLPGGFPMIVVVDEFCSGSWSDNGGDFFFPLDCRIEQDPLSGIFVPCFILPQPVAAGDVIAIEPGTNRPSDLLRFPDIFGNGTADRVYFFSDQDSDFAPSDVGLPDQLQPNLVVVFEMGVPEVFDFFIESTPLALYLAISDYPMRGASDRQLKNLVELLPD